MNLNDLIAYIIKHYPVPDQLSKARLNKIIYLIDWKSVLNNEEQMTQINWYFNHYGPYVNDIENLLIMDNRFTIIQTTNFYGNEKNIISIKNDTGFIEPTFDEKSVIDFIIEKTIKYNFSDFIKLVYSTYPIISQPKGSILDLKQLAIEYKELKQRQQ